jgi:PAS domain S-box-containing protein
MKNPRLDLPGPGDTNRSYPSSQLEQLFQLTADLVIMIRANGSLGYISKKSFAFTGYTEDELSGSNYAQLVSPSFHEKSKSLLFSPAKGVSTYEMNCLRKNGSEFKCRWSCMWAENNESLICFVHQLPDDQEDNNYGKQLLTNDQKSDTHIVNIFHGLGDGFFAVDENWKIISANLKIESILKASSGDCVELNLWECFPDMKESVFHGMFLKAVREKLPVHFEGYSTSSERWIKVHAYPLERELFVFFQDISEKKKTEVELLKIQERSIEQNQMMAEVLEQMTSGFLTIRLDGKILYWNKHAEIISGIPRETILGKLIWDVFPGIKDTPYYSLYKELLDSAVAIHKEVRSPYLGRWMELHAYSTHKGISVFFRDIHDKKAIEEELHKHSLIVKDTANGVSIIDPEGKIVWINEAYTMLTGYTFKEVEGKKNSELLTGPGSNLTILESMKHKFQNKESWRDEILCYNKDQQPVWFETSGQPLIDKEGNCHQYFIIFTEITQRKRAEEELQKLSLIAEQTVNAVAISDSERTVSWVNKACIELSGYSFDEAVGKKIWELFDGPETDPEVIAYTQRCVERNQPFQVEVLNYKKNGETYWANVSCQPLLDKQGKLQCFFSIATDITEKKKLEQELESQRNNITAAVIAAQEKVRAVVGQELHDNINQVLTTVKLYNELCRDGIGNADELLGKSVDLLQNSITEIRNLSKRLSAPTLGSIRLMETVKELVESIEATHRILINFDGSGIEGLEVSQEIHLAVYRILQEHFTNILKHADAKFVTVLFIHHHNQLQLYVKDDGKGFDLNKTRRGIGITNMISRVSSLNGKISFKTKTGSGCELQVHLPL